MKIVYIVLSIFILAGCTKTPDIKKIYINAECPTFNAELDIDLLEYKEGQDIISWDDVDEIQHFIDKKKVFNEEVKKLNEKSNELVE